MTRETVPDHAACYAFFLRFFVAFFFLVPFLAAFLAFFAALRFFAMDITSFLGEIVHQHDALSKEILRRDRNSERASTCCLNCAPRCAAAATTRDTRQDAPMKASATSNHALITASARTSIHHKSCHNLAHETRITDAPANHRLRQRYRRIGWAET